MNIGNNALKLFCDIMYGTEKYFSNTRREEICSITLQHIDASHNFMLPAVHNIPLV
jgi:hypothetical protein